MTYDFWKDILFGISQCSILGPPFFNIFLCDRFFVINDVEFASYANDNTPYSTRTNTDEKNVALDYPHKSFTGSVVIR